VARFSFSPRFIEAAASEVGLPLPGCTRFWHAFFTIDQRLEELCWLLTEETECRCPHGRLYFEGLSQALAELAAQAQLSRSHFAQAFRQLTGHAPHQYLLRVRLNHARRMLAPVVIFYLMAQKHVNAGLTSGAVKG